MKLQDYLHLYLGCEIVYEGEISRLESIASSGLVGDENRDEDGEGWYHIDDIKPILRPLSDMTEEESLQDFPHKPTSTERCAEVTRWLLSKHFDLFGLIPAGLAIDKTKEVA